ncbi:lipoprotein [Pseudoalteromonas haloplanktis]
MTKKTLARSIFLAVLTLLLSGCSRGSDITNVAFDSGSQTK